MSHHGNENQPENKQLHEAMKNIFGEYPNGKLNDQDEGALAMMISSEPGIVKVQYPKPVSWIAFSPEEAIGLAQSLLEHARKAAKGAGQIITISL